MTSTDLYNFETEMINLKNKSKFPKIFIAAVLLVMYLPIFVVIAFSFNSNKNIWLWDSFTLKSYADLLADSSMFDALKNSLVLSTISSLSAAVISTLAAVGMARYKLKTDGTIKTIAMIPIMVPEIILGIVFLLFFSLLGIPFGMVPLIIAHTSFCIPYIFSTVSSRLVGLDKSYVEAAKDLGASESRAFLTITLPLIWPAVLSGMLMSFVMSFDDVIISSFLSGVSSNTLPIKIYSQMKSGTVKPASLAMCAMMFFVSIVLVLSAMLIKKLHNVYVEKHSIKKHEKLS